MPRAFAPHRLSVLLMLLALAPAMQASAPIPSSGPNPSLSSGSSSSPSSGQRSADRWARRTLRHMTLEEKIGQMMLVWAHMQFTNPASPEYQHLLDEMHSYHIGSFGLTIPVVHGHLVKSPPLEAAALTNQLQRDSRLPLLFAADLERGLPMRIEPATGFPAAMAFGAAGDPELARQFGRISALESRAIGIQWNWFPVADINSNPANPIINTRSFGADPKLVSSMVTAYIAGAHSAGLLVTAKHFPGHGDTDTDSHLSLARVPASRSQLDTLELVPFRAAIAAGVDAVMIGHLTVPALDPQHPASISPAIVTGLLQNQLGFHGLVVTDALDMGALMQVFPGTPAEVSAAEAVAAVQAGNDMVIIPADVAGAYNGLLRAARSGQISRQRIDRSVLKILRLKASLGLQRNRFVRLDRIPALLAQPDHLALAGQVSSRAVTLVRDQSHQLPLSSAAITVVLTDDANHTEGGVAFLQALREHLGSTQKFVVDASNADRLTPAILAAVDASARKPNAHIVVLAESFPSAGRTVAGQATGSAGLDPQSMQLLAEILKRANARTTVIAFGNPYIGTHFPQVSTYLCTFSNTPESGLAAVLALTGQQPITGHLPVTLPGLAERGWGIPLPASQVAAKSAQP